MELKEINPFNDMSIPITLERLIACALNNTTQDKNACSNVRHDRKFKSFSSVAQVMQYIDIFGFKWTVTMNEFLSKHYKELLPSASFLSEAGVAEWDERIKTLSFHGVFVDKTGHGHEIVQKTLDGGRDGVYLRWGGVDMLISIYNKTTAHEIMIYQPRNGNISLTKRKTKIIEYKVTDSGKLGERVI